MTKLSVNLNKIALLRNQRDIGIPSVLEAAQAVIKAGAHGVTVHPRPDERHIRYQDAYELRDMLEDFPDTEYNIEGNPFTGKLMSLLRDIRPDQATLVPDVPGQNTSDHGWDIKANLERLRPVAEELNQLGIRVSVFVDAVPGIELAAKAPIDRVELYTEPYALAFRENKNLQETVSLYADAAGAAQDAGLGVNAGHDLNLQNLDTFLTGVKGVLEVSIGHALIAEALDTGLVHTVRQYLKILSKY
ncbi:MAG: pyridoxine 5'-phosphate synthase [Phycisphaerae bacterium]|jgi:pyridoxine 5-phosphate synthase